MVQSNENIDGLRHLDFVVDEYGNYYEVVGTKTRDSQLIGVKLSHAYYEIGFSKLITDDLLKEYDMQHIGVPLQEVVKSHLKHLKKNNRKIFSIQELINSKIEVSISDILGVHPRTK